MRKTLVTRTRAPHALLTPPAQVSKRICCQRQVGWRSEGPAVVGQRLRGTRWAELDRGGKAAVLGCADIREGDWCWCRLAVTGPSQRHQRPIPIREWSFWSEVTETCILCGCEQIS